MFTLFLFAVLVLYENIICLRREVDVFWKNVKFTSVFVLFISTRLLLIIEVLVPFTWNPHSTTVSLLYAVYHAVLHLVLNRVGVSTHLLPMGIVCYIDSKTWIPGVRAAHFLHWRIL